MKSYKKNKLNYKNGYIMTKKSKVVGVDNEVVDLLNKLETDIQRAMYRKHNKVVLGNVVSLPEFERDTERAVAPDIEIHTPNLDAEVEKSITTMKELDLVKAGKLIRDYLDGIDPLVQWVADDSIISCSQDTQHQFDLPFIGDPLELDLQCLTELVSMIYVGVKEDGQE